MTISTVIAVVFAIGAGLWFAGVLKIKNRYSK